ncbi:hypothetical protein DVK00_18790 [Haloarcula sp. Atlit-47R]|uniref:hypothetical protein n=1 Tax=Haloarcula sp. Atlit-47R TaxID=2282132 RepID=UPI000EF1C251|nr:hypothetical protein [Haloarcula sp. Atlit-47R]RLM41889.1 hypothetical protein DVK00_18790 [Haloarcula sp. Atlit-47R]
MSKTDTEIACKIVEKALRNRVIGGKHFPVEGLLRIALPDHLQGRGGQILHDDIIPNHKAGVTYVKGNETVTISDTEKAVKFLEENGGNVPFNFQ